MLRTEEQLNDLRHDGGVTKPESNAENVQLIINAVELMTADLLLTAAEKLDLMAGISEVIGIEDRYDALLSLVESIPVPKDQPTRFGTHPVSKLKDERLKPLEEENERIWKENSAAKAGQ